MKYLWLHLQITGTGHGIGKELAIRYASLGATVVCWDLNQEANEETVNEIKKMGTATVHAYQYVYLGITYIFHEARVIRVKSVRLMLRAAQQLNRFWQFFSFAVQMRRRKKGASVQRSWKSQAGGRWYHYFSQQCWYNALSRLPGSHHWRDQTDLRYQRAGSLLGEFKVIIKK